MHSLLRLGILSRWPNSIPRIVARVHCQSRLCLVMVWESVYTYIDLEWRTINFFGILDSPRRSNVTIKEVIGLLHNTTTGHLFEEGLMFAAQESHLRISLSVRTGTQIPTRHLGLRCHLDCRSHVSRSRRCCLFGLQLSLLGKVLFHLHHSQNFCTVSSFLVSFMASTSAYFNFFWIW